MKITHFGKELIIDERLKAQCDFVFLPRIAKNWDNIIPITGMEGTGKTTLAFILAWYLSGPNTRIVFTFEQFSEAFNSLSAGGTIIWDEFIFAGMSSDANSKLTKLAKKIFVTGRKKRLNILLLMPSIFMMEKYFAFSRTICLLHCDSPDFINRGYAYWYSQKRKNIIRGSEQLKNTFNTPLRNANFHFRFELPPNELYSEEEYQKAKDEAISTLFKEDKEDKPKDGRELKFKVRFLKDHIDDLLSMSEEESAAIHGVNKRTIAEWKRFINEKLIK